MIEYRSYTQYQYNELKDQAACDAALNDLCQQEGWTVHSFHVFSEERGGGLRPHESITLRAYLLQREKQDA